MPLPIRRCLTKPGSRSATCGFEQLGVARCPCDGSLSENEYSDVIATLLAAIDGDPGVLLSPIRQRMVELAAAQRYEEAGWMRDRYRALARALDRRAAWNAMLTAGSVRAEQGSEGAFIEDGRFGLGWQLPNQPLLPWSEPTTDRTIVDTVPGSVLDAEEAHLIWSWLASPGTVIIDSDHPFCRPAGVPDLAA